MIAKLMLGCLSLGVAALANGANADSITIVNVPFSTTDFGYLNSSTNSDVLKVDVGGAGGENINGSVFSASGTFTAPAGGNPGTITGSGTSGVTYTLSGAALTIYDIGNGFPTGGTTNGNMDPTPSSTTAGSSNADINTLLGSFVYGGTNPSETLTINNLIPGQTATLTFLGAAFGRGGVGGRLEDVTGTAGATVTPASYQENNGMFSTLTYSAVVPASGTISFQSTATDTVPSTLHIYAFTVAQTPEPASLSVLGIGSALMLGRRRFSR